MYLKTTCKLPTSNAKIFGMLLLACMLGACGNSNEAIDDPEDNSSEPIAGSASPLPLANVDDSESAGELETIAPNENTGNNESPVGSELPATELPDPDESIGDNERPVESELPEPDENSDVDEPPVESELPDPGENSDIDEPPVESELPDPGENSDVDEPPVESELPDPDANSGVDEPPVESESPAPDESTGNNEPTVNATLPIPLDTSPANTVQLNENNAENISSAIFRSQRALTTLATLAADLQTAGDSSTENMAALSLGNDFCVAGDGFVQATNASFAGAENPVLLDLNACEYRNVISSGEMSMAGFSDASGKWMIVELENFQLSINSDASTDAKEAISVSSGRFRIKVETGADSALVVTTIGESVDLTIGGYSIVAAPFDSTITRDESGTQTSTDSRISINSELIGGITSGISFAPLVLANDGLAISGGTTLRGMGSPVIEWFTGSSITLPDGFEADSTDVLADLRNNDGRTFLGNTWTEFLALF